MKYERTAEKTDRQSSDGTVGADHACMDNGWHLPLVRPPDAATRSVFCSHLARVCCLSTASQQLTGSDAPSAAAPQLSSFIMTFANCGTLAANGRV